MLLTVTPLANITFLFFFFFFEAACATLFMMSTFNKSLVKGCGHSATVPEQFTVRMELFCQS